jgi:hypothetical protein
MSAVTETDFSKTPTIGFGRSCPSQIFAFFSLFVVAAHIDRDFTTLKGLSFSHDINIYISTRKSATQKSLEDLRSIHSFASISKETTKKNDTNYSTVLHKQGR